MALPVNIDKLLNGEVVEWERIEFKKGYNPKAILHTLCAFANDIQDIGGGYIVIGIEEQNGSPILPPYGLKKTELDATQKKLVELCHRIQPHYLPLIYPAFYKEKHILVIRAPAGDLRPYKAPKSLGGKEQAIVPYIRFSSNTIEAKGDFLRQLEELTARIPFDDRMNQKASIDDLSLSLIRSHLQQTKSNLFEESHQIPFPELCRQMEIVKGDVEEQRPLNVGLLFFCENPWEFIPKSEINFTIHKDLVGRDFTEKIFNGPIQQQLINALDFIKTNIIEEGVSKVENKAEAERFYNYPYLAVEEVLANAIYHKGYDQRSPIEVQIFPYDRIEVISYPGPMPPIDNETLKKERITTRNYRNRRIGDFLKELKLTEGKATGFPLIYNEMRKNGSPKPEFHTDDDRTLFQAILYVHSWFKKVKKANNQIDSKLAPSWHQVGTKLALSKKEIEEILSFCLDPRSIHEIMGLMNWKDRSKFRNKYIKPLLNENLLNMTEPTAPNSPKQKYYTTDNGKKLIDDN